jgi:prevent-host-death family protein
MISIMPTINIADAKAQLSRLLDAAVSGEEIIIAKRGQPYVRLVPIDQGPRRPGALKDKIVMDERFFEPLTNDELDAWNQ